MAANSADEPADRTWERRITRDAHGSGLGRSFYRTNIRMSMAAGRWRKYQREKGLFPYLRYRSDHFRKHPRLDHKSWHGLILRVDDPAWQWLFPPNGWGCNCRVEQVSEARMRRMGWKVDEAPNPPRHDFITAAGEIVSVPQGIAPGFGYNPGTAHLRVLADRATASLTSAIGAGLEGVARQTLRELVADPAFDQFLALPDPQFPVMILDDMMAGAIGAKARVAVLSEQTMAKQLHKRGDLAADIYRQLPGLGDRPDVVARDGENDLPPVARTPMNGSLERGGVRWRRLGSDISQTSSSARL
ncbi:phage head morphogenesis protein [Sphingopyxis sp. FD7]|jgi:hypothetical protein|uniref:phage head morphogenesis protein n=1 Tax=Sphingopyxis sp. FD7 TaxID=1914525 RepID=UPI000E72D23A|nr:phage minor head protein [Sphingopyxis sp. FD7]